MPDQTHYTLEQYTNPQDAPPVFLLRVRPSFSPLDINVAFLARTGWLQSSDRLRFHHESAAQPPSDHPLGEVVRAMQPHLLIRRLDRAEDSFASVHITINGEVTVFSNSSNFARSFFAGVFLDCPPSFHTWDDVEVVEEWVDEAQGKAMFAGLLAGALGWDPSHNIPENIQESLDEAHKSLEIANYRSCVVMSRRTLEGVLKFGFRRLLGREPTDRRGHSLMLNAMIQEFRNTNPPPFLSTSYTLQTHSGSSAMCLVPMQPRSKVISFRGVTPSSPFMRHITFWSNTSRRLTKRSRSTTHSQLILASPTIQIKTANHLLQRTRPTAAAPEPQRSASFVWKEKDRHEVDWRT
jgi:hypothetical protein